MRHALTGRHPVSRPPGNRPDASTARVGWPVWQVAWVIVFGAFASGLDASVTNIGLDSIRADLHAGLAQVQWVASGYLLALAVSLPACAWLSRRAGTGRLWLAGLAAFTAASGACAAAPGIMVLIWLRVLQGLAGGLLIPAGQTVIGQVAGAARLGRVMATLGSAVSLAPAVGPVVGGLVLHWLSWRWLFLINLPIGTVGLALGLRLVPRGTAGTAPKPDWPGLAFIGAGLPLLVYGLTRWGATGTLAPAGVLVPLGAGAACLALFGWHTSRREHPALDLRLYRNRAYAAASVTAGCTGALMFGGALLYPLYFQVLRGEDTVTTGLRLLALGGGTALALPFTGRLTDRYGGGIVALCGALGAVVAATAFAVLPTANPAGVQVLLVLLGMAIAVAAVPPGIVAYQMVRPGQLPDATAQVNIMQRLGGSLGGAIFAVVVARNLPAGAGHAFHIVFWWQAAAALAAAGCALWLWLTLRRSAPVDPGGPPERGFGHNERRMASGESATAG